MKEITDRKILDEPYEEKVKLFAADSPAERYALDEKIKNTHVHRYHLVRGTGLLATLYCNELIARQIAEALNNQTIFFYAENYPELLPPPPRVEIYAAE